MSGDGAAPDPIGAAIEAPPKIAGVEVHLALGDGRPAIYVLPKDITEHELLAVLEAIIGTGKELRALREKQAHHGLEIVRTLPSRLT